MKPNIRVEQYQEAADTVSIGGIKWLTKYDVKIQFSDRDIAYFMKDKLEKFLQGQEAPPQRQWVGLTQKDIDELTIYPMNPTADLVKAIEAKLKEKNT